MIEDSDIAKDDSIAIEAYLHTRSLHELARNGQLEGTFVLRNCLAVFVSIFLYLISKICL